MIQVSDWFKTWMEKQTLNLLRKFTYDDIHETERVEGFGSINRASDTIVSGGTSLALINTDKHWNKFLSDKSNLRREAKLQLAIGVPNTPARSGIARSGATLSNLLSYTCISGNQEWLDILTGWADDPNFLAAMLNLAIRDKFAGLLEKELGSDEAPLNYYSLSYNPADLTWDILTTQGGLDSTTSTANTDIDYSSWSAWKTDCATANLSLEAEFTGQSIREALELIRDLTNSDIYVGGDGKLKFFRFTQAAPPAETYLFDEDKYKDFVPKLDANKILNKLQVYYDLDVPSNLVTNGDMEAVDSWPNSGGPSTNERSNEQAYRGTYSRKIVTNKCFQGAYQNITTEVGKKYKVSARVYVTAGEAIIGTGPRNILGFSGGTVGGGSSILTNHVMFQQFQAGFSGDVDRIVAYINVGVSPPYTMKLALYARTDSGEGTFVRATEEKSVDADAWVSFLFSSPVTIVSGNWYQLAIWIPDGQQVSMRYWDGGANWWRHAAAYDSWPAALVGTLSPPHNTRFWFAGEKAIGLSNPATLAEWVELSFTFTAVSTTSRLFLESNNEADSTFYVDEVRLVEDKDAEFAGSYLKEDPTSQSAFGTVPRIDNSRVVWHAALASATNYADRRIQIFKDPLEVIIFTSFMMGMITEVGDIVRITNAFFGYSGDSFFRVFKITDLNLAAGTISFEIANFQDVAGYSYTTPSVHDKSSETENKIENTKVDGWFGFGMGPTDHMGKAQKITLSGDTLEKVSFYLKKEVGLPTGTAYCRVRKTSDESIIETSPTELDVSTLSSDGEWKDFVLSSSPNEEVYITIEYDEGDSDNYIALAYATPDIIQGVYTQIFNGIYESFPDYDCDIKIYFVSNLATYSVDDDTGTSWMPDPSNEAGAWISWDMGSVKYSKGCRIYWGSEAPYRPSEYKIWVSENGTDWTEVVHETEAPPASAWKTYSWDVQQIRYFTLSIMTHGASGTKVYETDEYSIS